MKLNWREEWQHAWRDPVWSKVIATVITAMGGTALVISFAMVRSCVSPEQVANAPEQQPASSPTNPETPLNDPLQQN